MERLPFLRLALGLSALALFLVAPASAMALAGGSTGGGGGGGGGGGSYGGGSGSGSDCEGSGCVWAFGITVGIVLLVLGFSWASAMYVRAKRRARVVRAEQAATRAHADDGYWEPRRLEERVKQCFFPIQQSWEDRDIETSRPFVSDALYERHKLQLDGLEQQNRRNRIQDLMLNDIRLVRIHNVTNDGEDRFVTYIECSARDWVEDTETGALVNGSKAVSQFQQYWSFARHPEYGWVLDEIQQAEEGKYHETAKIVNADEGSLAEPVLDGDPYAGNGQAGEGPPAFGGAPATGAAGGTATAQAPPPSAADIVHADAPAEQEAWDRDEAGSHKVVSAPAADGNGAAPAANWYPDPAGTSKWRWWDGKAWTGHTSD